ncbi:PASTA domain-containing protein [Actinocorallia sp. A-T 12471]|uniref:PASTA domain-containing protein n=1 Tax=Actinocorallia sp. A-T 12471 TaxID=3089813 RepID=UPI0029D18783|nr:PASTA domain-containing protein [Actinocorallia sp. A-T 12471]MDX6739363.1 PASTA domain-containing protein [Actinocorallia sp. A-T 12471]
MSAETDPPAAPPAPDGGEEMSKKTMVLLAGAMSVCVALVLGITLLVGGGGQGGSAAPPVAGTVPKLEGLTLLKATQALAERRLPIGGVTRVPSSLPAGAVVYTAPGEGAPVTEGSPVSLYVSNGNGDDAPTRVAVPYLLGVDAAHAARVLRKLGLRLEATGQQGPIAEQDPAPGTEVDEGTVVRATVP